MNTTRGRAAAALLSGVVLCGAMMIAADTDARGYGHRYGHGHRHYYGHSHYRSGVGLYFGVPAYAGYYGYYGYPRYYYPPAVAVPAYPYYSAPAYPYYSAPAYYPPSTYIEQPGPPVAAPGGSSGYWYYCRDSQAYYPYVRQCPSPWEQVVPNSAPPA